MFQPSLTRRRLVALADPGLEKAGLNSTTATRRRLKDASDFERDPLATTDHFLMTILSLSNISKRFGPTVALDGVNLQLRAGEVHALIGENGAGKSTLMNVLAGLIQPDEGALEVDGSAYLPSSPLDARARGIALI